jgi:hypothetical protein
LRTDRTLYGIAVTADSAVFEWDNTSELFLAPSYFKEHDAIQLGIHQFWLQRDVRGRDYVSFTKRIKPDSKLGAVRLENWNDLIQEEFPYNGKPVLVPNDDTGTVGTIIQAERPKEDILYTLYLGMENPQTEENLSRRLNALGAGIQVRE